MSSSDSKFTYDASVMQDAVSTIHQTKSSHCMSVSLIGWKVNNQSEPAYRTRIINHLNKDFAEKKSCLILRQPQPNPISHCFIVPLERTDEESSRYLNQGIPPRDLSSIDKDKSAFLLWIFDATGTGEKLPELELDPFARFRCSSRILLFRHRWSRSRGAHSFAVPADGASGPERAICFERGGERRGLSSS